MEPKISELLNILLNTNGQVLSRDHLINALWPDVIVSEDTLARTVSRLRAELGDSASKPTYIETIPKRGYRFLVKPEPDKERRLEHQKSNANTLASITLGFVLVVALIAWLTTLTSNDDGAVDELLTRADSLYMLFDKQSNEAALALYENVLEIDAENALARAGVANALVQRVVRWPSTPFAIEQSGVSLTTALASGQLQTPEATSMLERARLVAEKAVRLAPNDVQALKSLGFVYSAEGRIDRAIEQYQRAVNIDQNAWRSLINLGELYELNGQQRQALETFMLAFDAMQKRFDQEPQHVGPWQPVLGNSIAFRFAEIGDENNVQLWANKVLDLVPFDRTATTLLIESLLRQNKTEAATQICQDYAKKLSPVAACAEL
jgi:tetratricopeptide (TPR) repeat protein